VKVSFSTASLKADPFITGPLAHMHSARIDTLHYNMQLIHEVVCSYSNKKSLTVCIHSNRLMDGLCIAWCSQRFLKTVRDLLLLRGAIPPLHNTS
jgi:hypothetical protein